MVSKVALCILAQSIDAPHDESHARDSQDVCHTDQEGMTQITLEKINAPPCRWRSWVNVHHADPQRDPSGGAGIGISRFRQLSPHDTARWPGEVFRGGRVVASGDALIRRATFSSFRTTKCFYDVAFHSRSGRFLDVKKVSFVKNAFVFYHKWSKSLGSCVKMNICAFTHEQPRTRRCTIHMHSDTDTDPKHHRSLHFRTHLDQPRNCLFSSFAHQHMRPVESLFSHVLSGKSGAT